MATTDGSETVYFPSQSWFDAYRRRIEAHNEYAEQAADWGVDFDGDFVFEMRGLPIDDVDVQEMPPSLREEIERYVHEENGTYVGYSFVGLEGGSCTDARLLESEESADAGFRLTADADTWKELIRGELGVVDGLLSGRFDIDGDMSKVMQYSQAAVSLTEAAAEVDAEFIDEAFAEE